MGGEGGDGSPRLGKRKKEPNASLPWTTRFKKPKLPAATTGDVHGSGDQTLDDVVLPGAGVSSMATVYSGIVPGPMLLDFQSGSMVPLSEDWTGYPSASCQPGPLSGPNVHADGVFRTGGAMTRKRQLEATGSGSVVGKRRNIGSACVDVTVGGEDNSLSEDVHSRVRQASFNIPVTNNANETHGVSAVPLGPGSSSTVYGSPTPTFLDVGTSVPALQSHEEGHDVSQSQ